MCCWRRRNERPAIRSRGTCLSAGAAALAQGVTLPDVERVQLDNGVVIVLHEKRDVPLVGLQASIRGGAVSDPDGLGGMANLLARALEKGAGERDAGEFAEAIDAVGGNLSAVADLESIDVSAEFLARDSDLMIELLVDMLRAPHLQDDEIRKLRERSIDELRVAKDSQLRALVPIYGNRFLFADHPYGNSLDGDEESLAKITAADVRDYYANYFGGDRLIIAMAGDFDSAAIVEQLSAAFADWPAASAVLPAVAAPVASTGRKVLLIDKPGAAQSYFWIGNVGVGINYASRAELNIANTLFGGRFTSMLMDELRTKAGLTYGASSSLRREAAGGSLAMISYTKTDSTTEAIDLALSLLEKLRQEGVADEMIDRARTTFLVSSRRNSKLPRSWPGSSPCLKAMASTPATSMTTARRSRPPTAKRFAVLSPRFIRRPITSCSPLLATPNSFVSSLPSTARSPRCRLANRASSPSLFARLIYLYPATATAVVATVDATTTAVIASTPRVAPAVLRTSIFSYSSATISANCFSTDLPSLVEPTKDWSPIAVSFTRCVRPLT